VTKQARPRRVKLGAKRRRLVAAALAVVALGPFATSCGSDDDSGDGGSAGEKAKFGLITQLSVHPYFVEEANGARAEARRLGVDLQVVDSGLESAKVISLTRTLITSEVDGLAIVPSNTEIGPRVTSLAERADIPLVASDSPLEDAGGKAVPFVGLDNEESGVQVGEIVARIYGEEGWSPENTYYANVEAPFQACLQRTNAAVETFRKANPDFPEDHVIKVPYDSTSKKANDAMRATLTANPDAEHWLISACNDDGVDGALRALQNKGFPVGNVIGVGLGANLACQVFTKPYLSEGMRASTYLDPTAIGGGVVKRLYQLGVEEKDVPANTYIPTPEVNADNYQDKIDCK
jgi:L-arabinose transport system substrate-binding protein